MTQVFITRTSAYLPFEPVANDQMEDLLGRVGGRASRAGPVVLRRNGIKSRHYAIDPKSGQVVMTNAQLAANAVRGLGELADVDGLVAGTSLPDAMNVSHAACVHAELGWPHMEVTSMAGICLAGTAALKYAWLRVKTGDAERSVVVASELASAVMQGKNFEAEVETKVKELEARPEIAFEKDFLRWMLSDGAGAVLLEAEPKGTLPLRVEWIDLSSAAHELQTCMYAGAEKDVNGDLRGWATFTEQERRDQSIFAVKQDVRLLNDNVVEASFAQPLKEICERRGLKPGDVDWFLPHLSSKYFFEPVAERMKEIGMDVPQSKWFTNLFSKGNTGSASPFIMLDELVRSGRLQSGQKVLLFVPESGRFSSGFVYLTVM
jgi:3-oxoacyl-[acyl-carrier-protein] synthase-3